MESNGMPSFRLTVSSAKPVDVWCDIVGNAPRDLHATIIDVNRTEVTHKVDSRTGLIQFGTLERDLHPYTISFGTAMESYPVEKLQEVEGSFTITGVVTHEPLP